LGLILGFVHQNLIAPHQTGYMRISLIALARTSAHEAFSRARMDSLETDVAFLPFRVRRAFLDRDGEGLLVFFVGIIVFRVAAAVYFLTHLLVAAAPVVMLASGIAIPRATAYASRRVVGQLGAARGAIYEEHFRLAGVCE